MARNRVSKVSLEQIDAELGQWTDWLYLRAKIEAGDELWQYCTPQATWDEEMGQAGYALYRRGKLIGSIMTKVN